MMLFSSAKPLREMASDHAHPNNIIILNLEPKYLGIHTNVDHVLVQSHPSNMLSKSLAYIQAPFEKKSPRANLP